MRSLLRGMIAVCGIGRPRGWRNSAVTANQSARPPTIAASAKARMKPQTGCTPSIRRDSMNSAAIATSMKVARRRIRVRPTGTASLPRTMLGDNAIPETIAGRGESSIGQGRFATIVAPGPTVTPAKAGVSR